MVITPIVGSRNVSIIVYTRCGTGLGRLTQASNAFDTGARVRDAASNIDFGDFHEETCLAQGRRPNGYRPHDRGRNTRGMS
ncbi:hypothetical protein BN2476_470113 [Paraburkholderia piptadeniae]|uniref:Uncharacterized protein n=1 Tax=Paraburkholderia piptadeniae TaxID=1701573 RepID=A0A1N7SE51_9BURK|nr:hypothetical protein BN2476_470113 [Paraburkholderia piptadeniae]